MALWDRLIADATSGRAPAALRQPVSESRLP
jgi:hypothetical protein